MSVLLLFIHSISLSRHHPDKTLRIMKTTIKVRNHTHVYEPDGDIAYRINTHRVNFKRWWIDEMALSLALIIPGADPLQVCDKNSPFYRAAKDMWDFMTGVCYKYDCDCDFYSFSPRPTFGDDFVAITYYKNSNHRPVQITYYNDGTTVLTDLQILADTLRNNYK